MHTAVSQYFMVETPQQYKTPLKRTVTVMIFNCLLRILMLPGCLFINCSWLVPQIQNCGFARHRYALVYAYDFSRLPQSRFNSGRALTRITSVTHIHCSPFQSLGKAQTKLYCFEVFGKENYKKVFTVFLAVGGDLFVNMLFPFLDFYPNT